MTDPIKTRPEAEISVIVPCRNEKSYIESALISIINQGGVDGTFEILVADGMSDDGTRTVLENIADRDSRIRVIDNPGKIVSTGLNAAIKAAKGEIIIRMDCHTEYAKDYIAQCMDALTQTGADNVGGPALTLAKSYMGVANTLAYHSPFSVGGAKFHDPDYEGYVDTVTYGCWKKTTLLKIDLFDEELVRNQDDELNLRIRRAGGKIWQTPKIRSWYYPRSSLKALFKQYMQYGYWKVRVIQKHKLPASFRHLIPGGFVVTLLILAVLSLFIQPAAWAFAVLLACYAIASFGASLITCRQPIHWQYLPVMPLVFGCYHFGYGIGFLRGVFDFVILRRRGTRSFSTLTRAGKP
ncbi:MAG: glycosyltransferase family 2 protein [Desulfobacterales bacterium]|nr:glycosyltransferase family 2 protein [Desulfobacterales bacterium]